MTAAPQAEQKKSFMDKMLNTVEVVGNKVPHPVLMFFYLIIGVIVLSAVLSLLGISVTEQIAVPVPQEIAAPSSKPIESGRGTSVRAGTFMKGACAPCPVMP